MLFEIRYRIRQTTSTTHTTQVQANGVSEARDMVIAQNGGKENCTIMNSKRVDN